MCFLFGCGEKNTFVEFTLLSNDTCTKKFTRKLKFTSHPKLTTKIMFQSFELEEKDSKRENVCSDILLNVQTNTHIHTYTYTHTMLIQTNFTLIIM